MRPSRAGSQSRDSSATDEHQSEDDWERASIGSAFDDGSLDEWALVGTPAQRSQTASPSGWDHLSELEVTSGPSSGRSTPGLTAAKCTFAERTCAGPFARSRRRTMHPTKPKLVLTAHPEEVESRVPTAAPAAAPVFAS